MARAASAAVLLGLLWVCLTLRSSLACVHLVLHSDYLGQRRFAVQSVNESLAADLVSGHASYESVDDQPKLYLYHVTLTDGRGRWIINSQLGAGDSAIAFMDSWAVMPTLAHALTNTHENHWQRFDYSHHDETQHRWVNDPRTFFLCIAANGTATVDDTIYLEVHGEAFHHSGFYVRRADSTESQVYSHIGLDGESKKYLYKKGDAWVIGEEVQGLQGLAYVLDRDAARPGDIRRDAVWNFIVSEMSADWLPFHSIVLVGDVVENVYSKLWKHRSIKYLPENSYHFVLRNGIPMPALGFGSSAGDPPDMIAEAMREGYRMFDLARENRNEENVGRILHNNRGNENFPARSDVFLISKVWPTNLGFFPTSKEIAKSLMDLKTSYVDLYMIHWPVCKKRLKMHHCHTAVDKTATWVNSWYALERAYAEGRVSSIGVSNYNANLLEEFRAFANVLPHAVQNFAEPGELDFDVRAWCARNNAVFIPYSVQRNLKFLPKHLASVIQEAAVVRGVSMNAVILRFFLQSGAAIIPRTSKVQHMRENYNITAFNLTAAEMTSLGWPPSSMSEEL